MRLQLYFGQLAMLTIHLTTNTSRGGWLWGIDDGHFQYVSLLHISLTSNEEFTGIQFVFLLLMVTFGFKKHK